MRYQIVSAEGFTKYMKIKHDAKQLEFPSLMVGEANRQKWLIGDGLSKFTLNAPENYLVDDLKLTSKTDLKNIINIFLPSTIDDKILLEKISKAFQTIEEKTTLKERKTLAITIQPLTSDSIIKTLTEKINELQIKHIAITNFLPLLNNQRKLVNFLAKLRTSIAIDTTFYLLSPVPHTYLPILTYLGIDVFSNEYVNIATTQKIYLTDNSAQKITEIKEISCNCKICSEFENSKELIKIFRTSFGKKSLETHNNYIFLKKIREIRNALKNDCFRQYLEQSIQTNVLSAAALKIFDKEWANWLISRTPTWLSNSIKCITSYCYTNPAIIAYQNRVRNRFSISKNKKIVVLFQCSAKKPYSKSRSHKHYQKAIDKISNKSGYIQELILTSPIGVVPRELEDVYPAAHYDIPVTGEWNYEEKEITINQLANILEKTPKDIIIIAHVSNEYVPICEAVEKKLERKFIFTSKDKRPTSKKSLERLYSVLNETLENFEPRRKSDLEKVRTIADYHFGKDIGSSLYPNTLSLKGRAPLPLKILEKREQLGVLHTTTGKITLSLKTAKALKAHNRYYVAFEGEELQGSTLFAVGVNDADPNIRPTDEVIIINSNKELVGIGEAIVSGRDMKMLSSGPVVKIRHKIE